MDPNAISGSRRLRHDRDGKKDRVHVDVTRSATVGHRGLKVSDPLRRPAHTTRAPPRGPGELEREAGAEHRSAAARARGEPGRIKRIARASRTRSSTNGCRAGSPSSTPKRPDRSARKDARRLATTPRPSSMKSVVDWLNGRAKGFTTLTGIEEVKATSWSTGKVGMIGTSYEGTLPLAAATTGVEGLEASCLFRRTRRTTTTTARTDSYAHPADTSAKTSTCCTTSSPAATARAARTATRSGRMASSRAGGIARAATTTILEQARSPAARQEHQGGSAPRARVQRLQRRARAHVRMWEAIKDKNKDAHISSCTRVATAADRPPMS